MVQSCQFPISIQQKHYQNLFINNKIVHGLLLPKNAHLLPALGSLSLMSLMWPWYFMCTFLYQGIHNLYICTCRVHSSQNVHTGCRVHP